MTGASQFVTLALGAELFAVPVRQVREILDFAPPFAIPESPAYVLGLIDVRGRATPTIDLRRKLGLPPAEPTPHTRVLVVDIAVADATLSVGLVADRVIEVAAFEAEEIEPAPEIGVRWRSEYIAGVVRRGTLGIDTQDVDARLAQGLGLAEARGAVVTRVYPGSAAGAAGLKVGDVVVAANGQPIDNAEALRNFQGLQAPDATVVLDLRRDGKPVRITSGLREAPKALDGGQLDPRLAGASFAELPESLRRQGLAGVLVEKVQRGSRAQQNYLQPGDVVLAASTGDFSDLTGFRASLARTPDALVLQVLRNGRAYNVPMR